VNVSVLAALAEPNRLRIVELLDAAPRSVGERKPLGELRDWLTPLTVEHPTESVLEHYEAAVEAEMARAVRDAKWAVGRTFRFATALLAPPETIWSYWTSASLVRRWWAPEHFDVAECEVDPVVGGTLRIVLQEGDGTRHDSSGRFLVVERPDRLSFELAPVGRDGSRLFEARHDVALAPAGERTQLALAIRIADSTRDAAPAIAGIEIGWRQLLERLGRVVVRDTGLG
jgi:uncharacterized protein YndB with AHSA1/START domain